MGMIFSKELEANLETLKEVATVAALSTISSPTNELEALVLADENNSGKKSKYKYNGTAWVFVTLLEDLDHKLIFTDKQSIYLTNKNKQPIKMGDILPFVDYAALLAANPAIPNKLYMTMKGQLYYYNTTTLTYKLISGGGGSGGSSLLGTVATKALMATTYPNSDDYNSVIVTDDEDYNGQTTWYLWLNNTWNYQGIYFPETLEISVSEKNTRVDVIAPNTDYTIPIGYLVGKGHLSIYLEGELLLKDIDYVEVGTSTYKSTKIQFKYTIPKEARLVFIRNVASYSGDSMITRLTSEVFLKYANDSWSGLNTLVTTLGFDNLTKSTNVDATSAAVVKTVPSNCKIGTRLLYRKVDSSTNLVTINMPSGETVSRASLTSLTLTSKHDWWEIEKITDTAWALCDGYESGSDVANSTFERLANGKQKCFFIGTEGATAGTWTYAKPFVALSKYIANIINGTESYIFYIRLYSATINSLKFSKLYSSTSNASLSGTWGAASGETVLFEAEGRWYA